MSNIFSSPLSGTNPFTPSLTSTAGPSYDDLASSYAKLEALKAKQNQLYNPVQPATVFTDINQELNGLSEDETTFISNSPEYQAVNAKYQNEFSQFLIAKFSNEYLQSTGNSKTLEEMLSVIKRQKEKYRERFANDINEIRDQNKSLLEKNNELAESNATLQKQLKEIQERLWKE
jgi:chromosome segregation ATPase